jgi:peptidoglycan/LPS O-acetylase OafA/YrhL
MLVVIAHGIVAFDYALFSGQSSDSISSWDVFVSGAPLLVPLAGNLAVCIFFALSGYVLSQSFATTGLGIVALVLKRYTRLSIPILTACLVSYSLLAGNLMANVQLASITRSSWLARQMQQAPSITEAVREGLYSSLIHLKPVPTPYDSVLWTMCIEFWGSIVLILVFGLTGIGASNPKKRETRRIVTLIALGILGCTSYLGLFALGALLYISRLHLRVNSKLAAALLILGVFLGTVPFSSVPWQIMRSLVAPTMITIPGVPFPLIRITFVHSIGAVFILISANSFAPFRRMLSSPGFRFLGRISFPLYLVHSPILMSVVSKAAVALFRVGLGYAASTAIALGLLVTVSVAVATGLLYICELPSIKFSGLVANATDGLVRKVFTRALGFHPQRFN